METLEHLLQRSRMFDLFVKVFCRTPHASGNEAEVVTSIAQWAETSGFASRVDATGNLGVLVPGRGKFRGTRKALLLQAHVDMVPKVAEGVVHDFATDTIKAQLVDGWLTATGTTLGADNGMGATLMMALSENPNFQCPPLVLLFTVREETDLGGASGLNPFILFQNEVDLIGGINLDGEEGAENVYFGSAGGVDVKALFIGHCFLMDLSRNDYYGFELKVSGFAGGHSAIMIDKGHQNAVRVMARIMQLAKGGSFFLADGKGGEIHNGIPTECILRGYMEKSEFERLVAQLPSFCQVFRNEVVKEDANFKIAFVKVPHDELPGLLWCGSASADIIDYIDLMPNGMTVPDQVVTYKLPRTSSNLGIFLLDGEKCELTMLVRSSVDTERSDLARRIATLGPRFAFAELIDISSWFLTLPES